MSPIFRFPPTSGQYQEVVLAYLDILGFKSILEKECKDSPDFLLRLLSTSDFYTSSTYSAPLERRIASDSILVWSTDLLGGTLAILNICSLLQSTLLKRGSLIRGAIVKGNHFSDFIKEKDMSTGLSKRTSDEIIVSPVLATAVEAEKKLGFPRIIIDNSLIKNIAIAKQSHPDFSTFEAYEEDGRLYVDGFFTSHELRGVSHRHNPAILQGTTAEKMADACKLQAIAELNQIRKYIEEGIQHPERTASSKWEDIKLKYNSFVDLCNKKSDIDLNKI